jgi:hypothetical protein
MIEDSRLGHADRFGEQRKGFFIYRLVGLSSAAAVGAAGLPSGSGKQPSARLLADPDCRRWKLQGPSETHPDIHP